MPRIAPLVAAIGVAGLCAPVARADTARPCPGERGFVCSSVTVPLDRTGAVPGTIRIRFAAQDRLRRGKVLIALTGGPGQDGIPFGPSFAADLSPALHDHRLVVVDQRGTGRSSALSCPELQGLTSLQQVFPEDVAGCARRLGARRNAFASIDSADDLEVIRRALKVDRLALYGVSYGTWVAQQYARRYPEHVERLVLDSVVAPGGDPWDLGTIHAMPRVLRELCTHDACRRITADPAADLAAVVARMRASGPLRGRVRDVHGDLRTVTMTEYDLLGTLVSSDLNPWLQARLPAALAAVREGDLVPLLRLRRDGAGPPLGLADLSFGVFAATTCVDQDLPYAYADSFAERAARIVTALAALPDATFAPFDRATVDRSSAPQICLHWPDGSFRREATGPMPDVPTLILSGRTDLRTPLEGARALAAEVPHPQLVPVAGLGHSVLGSDSTGCVEVALRRFFAGRAAGSPCRGRSDALPLAPVPPRRLADVPGTAGVPGERGRVLRAAILTIADARTTDNEALYAGFSDDSGGGLRRGTFGILPVGDGDLLLLRRMVYVPGVVVEGAVISSGGHFSGRVRVDGPDGLSGVLDLNAGRVSGTLGGRQVHVSARALRDARVASRRPGPRPAPALPLPLH